MSVDISVHLMSGTVAGMMSVLVDYPLDTLKTRMQIYGNSLYRGYLHCARTVYRREGACGFYKGMTVPIMAQGLENAVLFSVHHTTLEYLRVSYPEASPQARLALSAAAAGAAVSVVLTPVEYIKCNMQVTNARRAPPLTTPQFIRRTWDRYGLVGFFRGFTGTFARAVPGNMAYFATYDVVKNRLARTQASGGSSVDAAAPQPLWHSMLAGGMSGSAYWTVMFPADVVKTRMQVEQRTYAGMSLFQAAKAQYRSVGIRGLYRGWSMAAARSFPSSAVVFSVYEIVSKTLTSPQTAEIIVRTRDHTERIPESI